MKYCQECKSKLEFPWDNPYLGCEYCREEKIYNLIVDSAKLRKENKFLKNELELINEQN